MHSEVAFSIRHLMVSNTRGRFTSYDVTIVTSEDPRGSWVTATMDLRRTDGGRVIEGELTLHGVTRQVPLAIEVNGFG